MSAARAALLLAGVIAVSSATGSGAQTPRRGGTVVVGAPASPLFREPACLNVLVERCRFGLSSSIVPKILEAPFDVGPDLTWRPRLVTRVAFTREPPFTLTYHIRPRARWSDGVRITAQDFVFTHRAILRSAPPDSEDPHVTEVRSVRALNAKTVRVVLRSRLAGWRGLFGPILPRHALAGEDLTRIWIDRIDNPKTGRPIGSGPFLFARWERGEELTLRRNPRYWGSHRAYLDRLVLRFGVGGEPLDWFRRAGLDVAFGFAPGSVPGLRREPGLRVLTTPGSGWDHFEIRLGPGGHPALKSKLVRRALAYGIDRVALARQVVGEIDQRTRARPLDSAVFLTESRYYTPNWSRYRFLPSRARRLLEQAGCRRGGDGIYACAGQRLRLRFVTTGLPGGYRQRLLELVPRQLRQAGVEVIPTFATSGALFGQIIQSGNFDLVLFAYASGPDPVPKPVFGCGGSANVTGYCQRLVTRDLDQAERILDSGQRARVLNRADVQIARDVPVIPLFQQPQSAALRRTIRNFVLSVNSQVNFFWNAENWWVQR